MIDFDFCCYVLILLEYINVEDECRLLVFIKKVGEEVIEFVRFSRKLYVKVFIIIKCFD